MKPQPLHSIRGWMAALSLLFILALALAPLAQAQAGRLDRKPGISPVVINRSASGSDKPGPSETSAFLAGKVAVGIIAPESDSGSINEENWSAEELDNVNVKIRAGLQYWADWANAQGISLQFIVDVNHDGIADDTNVPISTVNIASEPISTASGDYANWTELALNAMGYSGTLDEMLQQHTNTLRSQATPDTVDDTNWAFIIFVADSSSDNINDTNSPGAFSDGKYMIAPTFGPLEIMTYNNGTRGIGQMDWVTAELTARAFGAGFQNVADVAGGNASTTQKFGYLAIPNTYYGVASPGGEPDPRLMYDGSGSPDSITKQQVGWRDSDGDGIIDPLDTQPVIVFPNYSPDPTTENPLTYPYIGADPNSYIAYDNPLPAATCSVVVDECYYAYEYNDVFDPNPAVTINQIAGVKYRVDNDPSWGTAALSGTAPDYKNYSFTTSTLAGGKRKIQVYAVNSVGNLSATVSDEVTVAVSAATTNDTFPGLAIPSVPYNHAADSTTATELDSSDPLPSCAGTHIGTYSVWYRYAASSSTELYLDTLGSNYDTVLSVWSDKNSSGNLTSDELVDCNDDIVPGSIQQSSVSFSQTAGTTYYFLISEFNNSGDTKAAVGMSGQSEVSGQSGGILILSIDRPIIMSIVRQSPVAQIVTSGGNVTFRVTFSASVTGVDTTDFELSLLSIPGANGSIVSITPVNDTVYDVTVDISTIRNSKSKWDGAIRLDVPLTAGINDLVGNALTGLPYTSGQGYSVVAQQTFPDVLSSHWAWTNVERLFYMGITGGYTDGTYRPENTTTRAEMAVFLLKAKNGATYTPPNATPTFTDTAGHWAEDWIEALKTAGITSGYSDGTYRPDNTVSRAEMAVFLLKALNGSSYTPPNVSPTFSDTAHHWAEDWIEALKAAGITSGYPDGTYRPDNTVSRAEMAVFLVKAFGLP